MLHDLLTMCALVAGGAVGALLAKPTTTVLVRAVARRPRRYR